jgi:hypothetical protein
MPKKKSTGSAPAETLVSKTQFVLDIPVNTPAEEVVSKAAESGLAISKGYVYSIRARSKAGKGGGKKRPGRPSNASKGVAAAEPKSASTGSSTGPRGSALDLQLVNMIAEIGLVRAEEVLKNVRAKFRASV